MSISGGASSVLGFDPILSALRYFDPSRVAIVRKLWPLWMTGILNSIYSARGRCGVAGKVVELAWEHIKPEISSPGYNVETAWLPPLLGFLQLGEDLGSQEPPSHLGALVLRILSASREHDDFGPTMLPILASVLLPTHPLQSRRTALKVFRQFKSWWLSSKMESVSNGDRVGFLRAVGDPFKSTPDSPLHEGQQLFTQEYEPMRAAVVLIEFTSSDLWRDHLSRSNFASCEEVTSTAEGKESAFKRMRMMVTPWPFLCTPAKIITAIQRLEELQCPNITEVVLTWVWAFRGVDGPPVDHDGWRLIGQRTRAFYQTHGIGRLKVLTYHIMDKTGFRVKHWTRRCRVEGVRSQVRVADRARKLGLVEDRLSDTPLAHVCQLRRLYHLFGCNPTTWEEMFADQRTDEGVNVSMERSGLPERSVDWACDYPED